MGFKNLEHHYVYSEIIYIVCLDRDPEAGRTYSSHEPSHFLPRDTMHTCDFKCGFNKVVTPCRGIEPRPGETKPTMMKYLVKPPAQIEFFNPFFSKLWIPTM